MRRFRDTLAGAWPHRQHVGPSRCRRRDAVGAVRRLGHARRARAPRDPRRVRVTNGNFESAAREFFLRDAATPTRSRGGQLPRRQAAVQRQGQGLRRGGCAVEEEGQVEARRRGGRGEPATRRRVERLEAPASARGHQPGLHHELRQAQARRGQALHAPAQAAREHLRVPAQADRQRVGGCLADRPARRSAVVARRNVPPPAQKRGG